MADLSRIAGNPTHRLEQQYSHLMGIHDLTTLKQEATRVVNDGGISGKNLKKFQTTLASLPTVEKTQYYLTNFLLSGAGLSVSRG